MQPVPKEKRKKFADSNMTELAVKPMFLQDKQECPSDDFEWDNDFESSPNQAECRTLLAGSNGASANNTISER